MQTSDPNLQVHSRYMFGHEKNHHRSNERSQRLNLPLSSNWPSRLLLLEPGEVFEVIGRPLSLGITSRDDQIAPKDSSLPMELHHSNTANDDEPLDVRSQSFRDEAPETSHKNVRSQTFPLEVPETPPEQTWDKYEESWSHDAQPRSRRESPTSMDDKCDSPSTINELHPSNLPTRDEVHDAMDLESDGFPIKPSNRSTKDEHFMSALTSNTNQVTSLGNDRIRDPYLPKQLPFAEVRTIKNRVLLHENRRINPARPRHHIESHRNMSRLASTTPR